MQSALERHNGQRLESFSPEVKLINKLTANNCGLSYEVTNFEIYCFDLKDIDSTTIRVERIGPAEWVTFKTRYFHRSICSLNSRTNELNFASETGGFSLDGPEVANSFSRAFSRAVSLCGGKSSTF